MFGLDLLSASVSTIDLVTLKFQTNTHPPLATSTHPVAPFGSSCNSSAAPKLWAEYINSELTEVSYTLCVCTVVIVMHMLILLNVNMYSINIYIYIYIYIYTQGVPGGMCQTSGGCSLC